MKNYQKSGKLAQADFIRSLTRIRTVTRMKNQQLIVLHQLLEAIFLLQVSGTIIVNGKSNNANIKELSCTTLLKGLIRGVAQ